MATGAATAPSAPAVEAVGLRKRFGKIQAVDGVDLALAPGRIYGLLGPNGSGKTTLIRMLAGLARATGGEARILGTKMPSRPMLARIGYMPQAEALYPELSVGENLGFFASLLGRRDRAAIDGVLDLVELRDRKGTPALELSGGMRRRLSLACTLVHEPEVIFLDEPTVGVDPALRVQFWAHFRRLAAARHDDPRREPRHGRGRPLRRARVHARRQGDRAGDRRRAPRPRRHGRPRGRVPRAVRPRRRGQPAGGRPTRRRRRMSLRRILAIARRIAQGFRRDERTLGLMFVVPLVVTALLGWVLSEQVDEVVDVAVVNEAGEVGERIVTAMQNAAAEPEGDITVAAAPERADTPEARGDGPRRPRRPRDRHPGGPPRDGPRRRAPDAHGHHGGHRPRGRGGPLRDAPVGHGRRRAASSCRPAPTRRCCPQVERRTIYLSPDASQADVLAPIFLGFFGYFFVFLLTGVSFLRERIGGTLERLLATPVTRFEIVTGYSLGFGIFATIQVIALTLFILNSVDVPAIGRPLPRVLDRARRRRRRARRSSRSSSRCCSRSARSTSASSCRRSPGPSCRSSSSSRS